MIENRTMAAYIKSLSVTISAITLLLISVNKSFAQLEIEYIGKAVDSTIAWDVMKYKDLLLVADVNLFGNALSVYKHIGNRYELQYSTPLYSHVRGFVSGLEYFDSTFYLSTNDGYLFAFQDSLGRIVKKASRKVGTYSLMTSGEHGVIATEDYAIARVSYSDNKLFVDTIYIWKYEILGALLAYRNFLVVGSWSNDSVLVFRHTDSYKFLETVAGQRSIDTRCLYAYDEYIYTAGLDRFIYEYRIIDGKVRFNRRIELTSPFRETISGFRIGDYHILTEQQMGLYAWKHDTTYLSQQVFAWSPRRDWYSKLRMFGDTLFLCSDWGIAMFSVKHPTLSVAFPRESSLQIYPMPFQDQFTVETRERYKSIKAYTLLGKEIALSYTPTASGYHVTIPNPPAQTILRMMASDGRVRSRMVLRVSKKEF